jgi:cytoskeletal protein RodZ
MESIGKSLKKARQKKGVSLQEAASQTKIHYSVLENLEADNFEQLPSPMYVKGFLKRYAEYLGIESAGLIDRYLATHPKDPNQVLILEGKKISPDLLSKFLVPGIVTIALIIIFLTVFFVIRLISSISSQKPVSVMTTPSETIIAKPEVKPALSSSVVPAAQKKEAVSKTTGQLVLGITAEEDVWLELRCDDNKLLFQGVLPKGSIEIWKADSRFKLSVGNAGAVRLDLNNEPLGTLGEKGQVLKEIVLTREGITVDSTPDRY